VKTPKLALVRPPPAEARETPGAPAPRRTDEEAPTPAPFDLFAVPVPERAGPGPLELAHAREILDAGLFFTEYQPIVHAKSGRTCAFEALARFRRPDGRNVPPDRMFSLLHADPALLLRAELTLKIHQVEHAPRAPLFVNLDPDSYLRAGDHRRNPFLALFCSAPTRIVVEVTENLAAADAARAQQVIEGLRTRRLDVALDDVGAANGLLTFDAIAEAEVLKFDRTLLPRLRHPRVRALAQALVRMARETGARTVLEGVETTAEFVVARDLGFDLVQGYLFRDRSRVARR
jgi:EAL domain-containing protein (putative c-di-GMP-specific phosphodiesterase class I)